jgi:hypothetical protein
MTYVYNRTQYIVVAIAGVDYAPEFVALAVAAGSSSR